MEIQIHELQTLIQTMAINWDVINELCTSADATNQWLEQQLQSLHQEVTTLNAMTTQLAPPPVIPVPSASPQPLLL
ncbi:hypothetical protein AMATHDRAFT_9582 [Amanita thiersii Skay4041]|uniref:Uncharacterized protein n=1 Tax=Amanita thiersii Skay4041 TaxID=703135 RepID=A0A2A9N6I2_9AGAR|nr:hypothetical protein AMATHDRAFT_9582 [Amanita thiersii Skay4041]